MKQFQFVTGNDNKAAYVARLLGQPIERCAVAIPEVQSLDLKTVVQHKLRAAYEQVQSPVLVEDTSLECCALGRLPGTFIKYFFEELGADGVCRLVDGKARTAIARSIFGYFDGQEMHFCAALLNGSIADHPRGEGGFGWDSIFIPAGHTLTHAELAPEEYLASLAELHAVADLKEFLAQ